MQGLTNAIMNTLKWIHSHTPEEIMAKMPEGIVGKDKELYLCGAEEHAPDVFGDGADGSEGRGCRARRVQRGLA